MCDRVTIELKESKVLELIGFVLDFDSHYLVVDIPEIEENH
jgi:hypothetical protein